MWCFVPGDAKMTSHGPFVKLYRAVGGPRRASGPYRLCFGAPACPVGRSARHDLQRAVMPETKKPPARRLVVAGVVPQKGTIMSIISSRHTWPMVITAGSMERVRLVFMVLGCLMCCCSLLTMRNWGARPMWALRIERPVRWAAQVGGCGEGSLISARPLSIDAVLGL